MSYPSRDYYVALEIYRSGDLENAVNAFESALRRTRRDINGRWIDAIPVYAMLAECYWQFGDLEQVRANVDEALAIAVRYQGWLGNVDWQGTIREGAETPTSAWLWPDARAIRRLPMSNRVQFRSGTFLSEQAILDAANTGQPLEELNIKAMDVVEIMRGLSIASYRRRILLGPLCEREPLANQLVEATKFPASLQLPIGKSLIGSMRTVEHFGAMNDSRTLADAANVSAVGGGVHPLSPIALLALASAGAGTDKPSNVLPVAFQTANVAAALDQPEWIGEAMQLAAGCATKSEAAQVRIFCEMIATTMLRKSRLVTLHCLLAAADASITAGDLNAAQTALDQAMSLARRRDVTQPRLNAYGAYLAARLYAGRGQSVSLVGSSDVDKALAEVRGFAIHRSLKNRALISIPRLYQISRVRQAIGKSLGGRSSEERLMFYGEPPRIDVWRRDPVDAIGTAMADLSFVYETKLAIAASESDGMQTLAFADEVLRYRFVKRLELAGRIAQVRAIARHDDTLLDPQQIAFRNQAPEVIARLRQTVLAGAPTETEPLIAYADQLEAAACSIALDRVLIPETIPPLLGQRLRDQPLPPRTAILTFISVGNKLFGLLAQNSSVTAWEVSGAARLPAEIGRVMLGIGVGKTRGDRLPKDASWLKDAVSLRRHLLPDDVVMSSKEIDELVVVPDGPLWYLPMELLPVGDESSPLIGDDMQLRYAATPGLAVQPTAVPPIQQRFAIVSDKLFAPRDLELNQSLTQSLAEGLDKPLMLSSEMKRPSSLLGDSISHLLIAVPRAANPSAPLSTGVAGYDENTPLGTLAAWMRFPAPVPHTVLLPGFRTAIDAGRPGTGEDLFLLTCGLQTAGVRDLMISRWAVGGEATQILMKELTQEVPFEGMMESWKRAKLMLRKSELDPLLQPLLTKADHEREGLTGNEPLFWAGYMVVSPLTSDTK